MPLLGETKELGLLARTVEVQGHSLDYNGEMRIA